VTHLNTPEQKQERIFTAARHHAFNMRGSQKFYPNREPFREKSGYWTVIAKVPEWSPSGCPAAAFQVSPMMDGGKLHDGTILG
jgi:hypothetical protein